MKAAKYKGKGKIVVEDVDVPEIDGDDVLIKPKIGGICGSDLHAASLGIFYDDITVGHEFAGIIERVGPEVKGFKKGDRVTVNPNKNMCGECLWCQKGEYNLCKNILKEAIGVCKDGGFAEYVKVRSTVVSKLPDNVSLTQGAFVEPLATGLRSVRISRFKIGENALVIGAGPIGLLTIECLVKAGAKEIYVSELYDERIKLAKKLGADKVLNPKELDIVKYFKSDNLGICWDITHESFNYYPNEIPIGKEFLEHVIYCHLHGISINKRISHIALKNSEINFNHIIKYLNEINFTKIINLELLINYCGDSYYSDLISDIHYLTNLFEK